MTPVDGQTLFALAASIISATLGLVALGRILAADVAEWRAARDRRGRRTEWLGHFAARLSSGAAALFAVLALSATAASWSTYFTSVRDAGLGGAGVTATRVSPSPGRTVLGAPTLASSAVTAAPAPARISLRPVAPPADRRRRETPASGVAKNGAVGSRIARKADVQVPEVGTLLTRSGAPVQEEARGPRTRPLPLEPPEPVQRSHPAPVDGGEKVDSARRGARPERLEVPERPEYFERLRRVKHIDVERPPRTERPEPVERSERFERPERMDRPDRIEPPERTERAERPERPERLGRPERVERPERIDRPERIERPDRIERFERVERPGRIERLARGERIERPERAAGRLR
jgi:hypothetical protein